VLLDNRIDATDRPLSFGSRDLSLTGVEVVLTDRVSGVSGTVSAPDRTPVEGASVVVFAVDRDRWYPTSRFFGTALTGPDGVFTMTGLPGDSYYVTVVPRLPQDMRGRNPPFSTSCDGTPQSSRSQRANGRRLCCAFLLANAAEAFDEPRAPAP